VSRFRIVGSWIVVLEDGEGHVLLRSAQQSGRLACRATIVAIRMSALLEDRFARSRTDAGGHQFALLGYRGDPIATSPVYSTAEDCTRAIRRLRACVAAARVEHAELGTVPLETEPVTGSGRILGA
jgi:hypothetical protein